MQFTKPQIAALVLGFLKAEKLLSVVDEFVKTCSYFQENSQNIKMGKYFVTRIAGMSLVDFLEEYSIISAIIQSRLEDTPYFETHNRTTLVEQLLYLLDKNTVNVATSTPVLNNAREVEATPIHALPGNSSKQADELLSKTPKRRSLRNKSREKEKEVEEMVEITEVLTQSLLESHELHEKIAETINIVRNTSTSEGTKTVTDDISAGASRELDAVIKTVIQKTEEDPIYNKLIDEIIGTTTENVPPKKPPPCNTSTPSTSSTTSTEEVNKDLGEKPEKSIPDPIEDHNNDAIRSIVEVALNSDQTCHPEPSSALTLQTQSNEVYFFDGTLDTYLKSTGAKNPVSTNSLYINSNSLYVVPQEQKQQYYIVNNQPLLKMSTVLTEKDIMSIPTIIVSDDNTTNVNTDIGADIDETDSKKRLKRIKPKPAKPITKKTEAVAPPTIAMAPVTCAVTAAPVTPTVTTVSKQGSHIRNLDFSTPRDGNKKKDSWDSDLRQLVKGCKDKSPSPKRKKTTPASAKKKKKEPEQKKEEKLEKIEEVKKPDQIEDEREKHLKTPIKDGLPKTPCLDTSSNMQCTPFSALLEEQLQGVDLTSIPTPSIPITPGFALTPGMCHRNTDYSTASSSYYVPSDSEQPRSMDEVLEESREKDKCEKIKETDDKQVKILSDVVIEKPKTQLNEHLKKFNNHVIGKKNLSLIKSSIDLSSESEDEGKDANKTEGIKDILNEVEVKNTLDEKEARKKSLLAELEIKRQRTVKKIKSEREPPRKQPKRNTKKKEVKQPPKKPEKAKKVKKNEDDAQKLVKDLAQRGIHLIPNKKNEEEISSEFDKKVFESEECVVFNEKKEISRKFYDLQVLKKSMSVQVFLEDVNKEVSRIIKWTDCECLLDSESFDKNIEDDLMDEAVIGRSIKESHDKKGTKKRKRTEDDSKQAEKKNKMALKNNLKLLKKINVDDFLSKVHGE